MLNHDVRNMRENNVVQGLTLIDGKLVPRRAGGHIRPSEGHESVRERLAHREVEVLGDEADLLACLWVGDGVGHDGRSGVSDLSEHIGL